MNIKILCFFCLFFFGAAKSQEVSGKKIVSDTLAYAKRFETNKEKYLGKPFSLLLKDMVQMQPKTSKSEFKEDRNDPLPSTSFTFSDKEPGSAKEVTMILKWKPDDSPTTPLEFSEQEHNYRFTPSEKNFLENRIITGINVYRK